MSKLLMLLSCAFLVFCLLHDNEAANPTANFLKIEQRFDDPIYDSYYCCNICGGHLTWKVDEEDVASYNPDTTVGAATKLISSKNTNVSFFSTILSVRNTSETCMDSVLIASQYSPDWRPPVICRGGDNNEQYVTYTKVNYTTVNYTIAGNTPNSNSNGGVVVSEVINQYGIVYPNSNCFTQILICFTNETVLSWARDERYVAGFNKSALPGEFTFKLHTLNSTIVEYEALLLENNDRNIVSVIIWTDFDSVGSLNVSCSSGMDGATLIVNQPTGTDYVTSIATSSATSIYTISDNYHKVSTSHAAGSVTISLNIELIVFILGIIII